MATVIQEIHVNDAGTAFDALVVDADGVVNLAPSTIRQFHYQKPDGSMLVVDADLLTDGTDGWLTYSTEASDFDQDGPWRFQVYLEFGPDQKYSNILKFKVFPNLPLSL